MGNERGTGFVGRLGLAWREAFATFQEKSRRDATKEFAKKVLAHFSEQHFPDNIRRFSGESVVDLALFEAGTVLRLSALYTNPYGQKGDWSEWVVVASNIDRKVEVYRAVHRYELGSYRLHQEGGRLTLLSGWDVQELKPRSQQFKAKEAFGVLLSPIETAARYENGQVDFVGVLPRGGRGLKVDEAVFRPAPRLALAGAF